MVVTGTYFAALRTPRPSPRRFHREDDASFFKIDTCDKKTGNSDQYSGKLGDAHGFTPGFLSFVANVRKPENRALFNMYGVEWSKLRRGAA
jgi:hypothetical protein